jgi:hypothetical protein
MVLSIDASDYLRRRKLAVISNGNNAADPNKFRAPISYSSYDPSVVKTTGLVCNDTCRTDTKPHNVFPSIQFRGRLYGR